MHTSHYRIGVVSRVVIVLMLISNILRAQNCPCPGMVLGQPEFDAYTKAYEDIFRKTEPGKHTQWVYLPRNYFLFFNKFFASNPSYKGISFIFVSHDAIIDPVQQAEPDQIMFIAIAARTAKDADYDALETFYLSDNTLWDPKLNQVKLSSKTGTKVSRIGPQHIIFPDYQAIASYQREHPDDKHSKSVYICQGQLSQIKLFLDAHPAYGGVKLHFASYNQMFPCVRNVDAQQFTLISVPVPNEDSKSDLNVYLKFLKGKKIKKRLVDDYYNHGELCPNSCPSFPPPDPPLKKY